MVFSGEIPESYKCLKEYTTPLLEPARTIIGREEEIDRLMAAMMRPELCNVILLAEAGTGKTALVQGAMMRDTHRYYLEVDLSHMVSDVTDMNQVADRVKRLFDDVSRYCKDRQTEIVLFIDEFHQIVQLSPAAVEALKPVLAASGVHGIRVIAATTFVEFREHISPNQPLVERLQRINVPPPDKSVVVSILKDMAERNNVAAQFYNERLFEMIYEYTERYIPASAQPRKSIRMFDAMLGWHKYNRRKLNVRLLADVLFESEGINTAFRVDASSIKEELDKHVFAQGLATTAIEQRLQICVADLNNKNKPASSFLFCGSTGVGKTEVTKQLARILFNDPRRLIRFDMTEYANTDSLERFRSELTGAVWERPYSVVLLDEVEKACAPVTRLLLQVLDDGRLTDRNNREVTFVNCYIVLTTNAGSEIYRTISQYDESDTGDGENLKKYNKLIRESIVSTAGDNKFPPELLGRIDMLVPFQPLSRDTQARIIFKKLTDIRDELRTKHGVDVSFTREVLDFIVNDNLDTDSDSGGARAAVSRLETEVIAPLAAFVNSNVDAARVIVYVKGTMASKDKKMLESNARIAIREV